MIFGNMIFEDEEDIDEATAATGNDENSEKKDKDKYPEFRSNGIKNILGGTSNWQEPIYFSYHFQSNNQFISYIALGL